jgi:hypothetical protein
VKRTAGNISITANDIAMGVDPDRVRMERPWKNDRGEFAIAQQKAVPVASDILKARWFWAVSADDVTGSANIGGKGWRARPENQSS